MTKKSGLWSVLGTLRLLVVLAGAIGAAALLFIASERSQSAVTSLSRVPIGCTSVLRFSETGTFYVFAESIEVPATKSEGCIAVADQNEAFGFELSRGAVSISSDPDRSVTYSSAGRIGRSVARVLISETGDYQIRVVGDDTAVVAAFGRDPHSGVKPMWFGAIAAGTLSAIALLFILFRSRKQEAPVVAAETVSERPAGAPAWPPPVPKLILPKD